ncbi:hypothetical protein EPN28_02610 [Patescibacteria group bacterium]|nr:MAG: hypothetical protein EPN28_02610 [Patescibacteria group bacterium]
MKSAQKKGPPSPSSRHNDLASQHRGVKSGGALPSGDAKSPKRRPSKINSRQLEGMEFQYLLLDGLWVKCKQFGLSERNNTVLLCALGITKEGKREIVGFMTSDAEDAESWGQMLANLKERGLNKDKLELVIADDNAGLVSAVGHYLPGVKLQKSE